MAVLEVLLRQGSEPVRDDDLLAQVWPGVVVTDSSIYQAIAQLRKALGDSGKPYRFITRVSGKGYALAQPALRTVDPNLPAIESTRPVEPAFRGSGHGRDLVASPPLARRQPAWRTSAVALITLALVLGSMHWYRSTTADPLPTTTVEATPPRPTAPDQARPDSPGWDDYLQGRWLWNQRKATQLPQAAEHFRAAIRLDPALALAYVGLCDVFHFQHLYGDWPLAKVLAQCEPLLRGALQREAQLPAALASFGMLKLSQGEIAAAATYLERATTQDPNDAMAWLWSAQVAQQRGEHAAALEQMQRAERLDPLSAIIKRNFSHLLMSNGDFAGAQERFEEALLLEPDYADRPVDEVEMRPLTVDRAVAFVRWARRFPDRSATSNPSRGVGIQTNLAIVQLALADFDAADAALRLAEAADVKHPYVLLARAIWWRGKGDAPRALALLQERAALHPGVAFFRQVALLQQAEAGDAASARAHFIREFPEYVDAVKPPLQPENLRLLTSWLWLATDSERRALQPAVADLLERARFPERVALNLRLISGDREGAFDQWRALLDEGALPSPADDYFLPESHPLWRPLPPDLAARLTENRAQARAQLDNQAARHFGDGVLIHSRAFVHADRTSAPMAALRAFAQPLAR